MHNIKPVNLTPCEAPPHQAPKPPAPRKFEPSETVSALITAAEKVLEEDKSTLNPQETGDRGQPRSNAVFMLF